MIKKLKISVFLIVLGELLYWLLGFVSNANNNPFSSFTTGVLLGLSVGINLVGIILLIFNIVKISKQNKPK